MLLKRIKNNLLVFQRLIGLPKYVYSFLESGTYRYNEPCTLLYNVKYKKEASVLLENLFEKKSPNKNYFRKLFALLYRKHIYEGISHYKGFLLLMTSSGHEYKVFDLKNKEVLTIFDDAEKCKSVYNNREVWSRYFKTVEFKLNQDKNTIVEKMLTRVSCDSSNCFSKLLEDYSEYLPEAKHFPVGSYAQNDLLNFCKAIGHESDFKKLYEYLQSNEFVSCMAHGDLWYSNVMMTEDGMYYLDFENICPRIFYYDLIFFIVGDFVFRKDNVLLSAFRKGVYDRDFDSIFKAVGVIYHPDMKTYYIETVFFLLYLEKWKNTEMESNVKLVTNVLNEFN